MTTTANRQQHHRPERTDNIIGVTTRLRRHIIIKYLSETGENTLAIIECTTDAGPIVEWDMFYRHPNRKEFCEASEEAKKNNKKLEMDEYAMMESPGRKKLRDAAAISMMSNGRNMKMNASKIDGEIEVGSIVRSSLSDVDCTKVDGKCLTLVVVDKISEKGKSIPKYRLACAKGPLQGLYHRSYLTVIPMATRGTLGLEDIFISWRGVAAITERAAAASTSVIGG